VILSRPLVDYTTADASEHETLLVNTVAANKSKYTVRENKQGTVARRTQDIIGRPSTSDYVKIVEGSMVKN
jgi:hypothetical protein